MEKWFTTTHREIIAIALTATGIYLAVILFTRLAGKRSFSKMSSFDFAMTVAVGSILATTILSKSVSLLAGIFGLAMVYILQIFAAVLRRFDVVKKVMDNTPLLLMDGSTILEENLKNARVAKSDLRAKLREANVTNMSQIKAVVFETTGDISVLHSDDNSTEIDEWLLQDVKR
ncbi:MAG: DUF421 domain-containing protein [Cyclobacteriaceae bacterium]|nr:DUF421 domain-containing protein [Cyclobacteriaceae bacterium]